MENVKAIFEKNAEPSTQSHMDIWLIYTHVRQQEVWDNFERAIHLSLAPRRMKFFFKRYLDYEKQHGSEKDVQAVKAKALEYVEAKSSMMDD